MKLLLTSDLHRDGAKLLWLLDEAPAHDALLVAGDLLDIFSNATFEDQTSGALRWKNAILTSGRAFAWCSGNHDFFHGDHTPMTAASPDWMHQDATRQDALTDGQSRLLETAAGPLAVTTIPYPIGNDRLQVDGQSTTYLDFVKSLLHAGRKVKDESGAPWIILHHEPPADTPLAVRYASPEAAFSRRLIEAAEPDFSLHGHIHQAPTTPDGSWICRIGPTVCFNAGQSVPGEPPQTILLDWQSPDQWTAEWIGPGTERAEASSPLDR